MNRNPACNIGKVTDWIPDSLRFATGFRDNVDECEGNLK